MVPCSRMLLGSLREGCSEAPGASEKGPEWPPMRIPKMTRFEAVLGGLWEAMLDPCWGHVGGQEEPEAGEKKTWKAVVETSEFGTEFESVWGGLPEAMLGPCCT